ncbi:hypothetical protein LEP1GSC047_2626 [Leptospira inadai serovar Lyme str. 10]|uniref:Uncharacterized protein n=1 Tax=Leptospira inadai serovar Lyme str. 10 TaxID=1049790 RepID=V6HVE0_9LEPT|nr:hypothetical protein LEP1GSC047_2626 [Leptospira inadai serovar Lyme str. 10]
MKSKVIRPKKALRNPGKAGFFLWSWIAEDRGQRTEDRTLMSRVSMLYGKIPTLQ